MFLLNQCKLSAFAAMTWSRDGVGAFCVLGGELITYAGRDLAISIGIGLATFRLRATVIRAHAWPIIFLEEQLPDVGIDRVQNRSGEGALELCRRHEAWAGVRQSDGAEADAAGDHDLEGIAMLVLGPHERAGMPRGQVRDPTVPEGALDRRRAGRIGTVDARSKCRVAFVEQVEGQAARDEMAELGADVRLIPVDESHAQVSIAGHGFLVVSEADGEAVRDPGGLRREAEDLAVEESLGCVWLNLGTRPGHPSAHLRTGEAAISCELSTYRSGSGTHPARVAFARVMFAEDTTVVLTKDPAGESDVAALGAASVAFMCGTQSGFLCQYGPPVSPD